MTRILLVEDDDQYRPLLERLLTRAGHEVVAVSDGAQALPSLMERPADVVITDLIMPGKEGLETIRELRRQWPDLPIIAMSGGGRRQPTDYLRAARMLGAVRTLEKPFAVDDLLATIAEVTGKAAP